MNFSKKRAAMLALIFMASSHVAAQTFVDPSAEEFPDGLPIFSNLIDADSSMSEEVWFFEGMRNWIKKTAGAKSSMQTFLNSTRFIGTAPGYSSGNDPFSREEARVEFSKTSALVIDAFFSAPEVKLSREFLAVLDVRLKDYNFPTNEVIFEPCFKDGNNRYCGSDGFFRLAHYSGPRLINRINSQLVDRSKMDYSKFQIYDKSNPGSTSYVPTYRVDRGIQESYRLKMDPDLAKRLFQSVPLTSSGRYVYAKMMHVNPEFVGVKMEPSRGPSLFVVKFQSRLVKVCFYPESSSAVCAKQ